MSWWSDNVSGDVSQGAYNAAPKVNPVGASTYQNPNNADYANSMQGAGNEFGAETQQANQGIQGIQGGAGVQDQQALQKYLQSVAMGQAPSAADQMLQNQQAQLGQRQQSQMVSAGQGMNPALAMRQLFQNQNTQSAQLAGQGAQQKLQEQQQFAGMAQQGGQALYNQQMQATQQQYENSMGATRAKQAVAQGIYNANDRQTSYNIDHAQNQQAYETMMRQEYMQHAQDQARASARIGHAVINGGLTVGGAVVGGMTGGPMGAMAGGAAGGALGNAITGSGSSNYNIDPALIAAMTKRGGGDESGNHGATGYNTQTGWADPYSNDNGQMEGAGPGQFPQASAPAYSVPGSGMEH